MEIKAYKRRFYDEVVLIDEDRQVENPQGLNYAPKSAYPAVGVSTTGDIRWFALPSDDEFWAEAEETRNQAEIATAIENAGGKERIDRIFSRIEAKLRR